MFQSVERDGSRPFLERRERRWKWKKCFLHFFWGNYKKKEEIPTTTPKNDPVLFFLVQVTNYRWSRAKSSTSRTPSPTHLQRPLTPSGGRSSTLKKRRDGGGGGTKKPNTQIRSTPRKKNTDPSSEDEKKRKKY